MVKIDIKSLLHVGDLRSAGKSAVVVEAVLEDPGLFGEVVDAMQVDHPAARMRAADAVEKISRLHPEWLRPYKRRFLNTLTKIDQKEVRWHLAQILPRLSLTKKERQAVFDLMMHYLDDDSRIVRTFAMQALADLAVQDTDYAEEVTDLVTRLMRTGAASMQSRGRKLLAVLKRL